MMAEYTSSKPIKARGAACSGANGGVLDSHDHLHDHDHGDNVSCCNQEHQGNLPLVAPACHTEGSGKQQSASGHEDNVDVRNARVDGNYVGHGHDHSHGHSHEPMNFPGDFATRPTAHGPARSVASFTERAFTVGIGGPVGSGKTALLLQLCRGMRNGPIPICVVTNDIFTREDGEFLIRNHALEPDRIRAVETGGCPHAAIREDISANLTACEALTALHCPKIIFVESGGDNLAANFSKELADFTIYVIDVAGGDKVPRKGGPGITQSDVLVVNKTDLAAAVGASLAVMAADAKLMRGAGPTVFAQMKHDVGTAEIIQRIVSAFHAAEAEASACELKRSSPMKKSRVTLPRPL